ncbi:MAG: Gfo/Idh/MocA family oxidoreductase [Spirochaetes bacterium]|nr:Gfo/Idh/MocA family oxidoreductase [Spirochaetota bacterium]
MSSKIKVAVIGLGIGKSHLKGYQSHPDAEIVAVCDLNQELGAQIAAEYKVPKIFTDAEKMFKECELDAVSVCTPNKFHAPLTMTALEHGLHVLCEKPMAMNTDEAIQMNDLAKKKKKNLMINFSYRFNPMSYALKQEVDKGTFGDIYFGRTVWHRRRGMPKFGGWFGDKELSGGGPLIDLGVHRVDLALWLMGYPEPVSVFGSTYNPIAMEQAKKENKKYTVEDLACGIVKFKNGATLIVEASWAANIKDKEEMNTRLCGTKGGLMQYNLNGEYKFEADMYTDSDGFFYTKKLDFTTAQVPAPAYEFVDSIKNKRPPLATGDEGIKVMKILDGIYTSAATGKQVTW